MLSASTHLLNLVYPDSSCYRDKVSRAAGRRAVGSVFCSPFIKCTVTSKLRCYYRDSYVISFYRDGTPFVHLPGLAKNSPTLTQTAPNYTTEPLGAIILSFTVTLTSCLLAACPDMFAFKPRQFFTFTGTQFA